MSASPIRELRCAFNVFDDAVNIMQTCSADLQEIYVHLERQYNNMIKSLAVLRSNATLRGPLHVYYGTQGLQRCHMELVNALATNIAIVEETMQRALDPHFPPPPGFRLDADPLDAFEEIKL